MKLKSQETLKYFELIIKDSKKFYSLCVFTLSKHTLYSFGG